ncbi:MAG TPA: sugar phosphate nucleotidyltransferase [Bacteroidota bacterium]|nr:sugar phosphate nucleotidyltransferase [Bacteroidota bacterium]
MRLAIIAAGEGSRLRAEGVLTPKPLLPICGVPLIERILRTAGRAGITDVCCIVNEQIAEECAYLARRTEGPPLTLVVRTTESSMHSLFVLSSFLRDGPFCLTTVDSVFRDSEFLNFLQKAERCQGADGLLAVTRFIDDERPLCVVMNSEMQILDFSDSRSTDWATGGVYYFTPRIFTLMEEAMHSGTCRLRNFLRLLNGRGFRLYGYPFSKIIDVDHKSDIAVAEAFLEQTISAPW